jgi:enolase-phosphatase E1
VGVLLLDVEGTTTDIAFVHDVLFPHAREHLSSYVRTHAASVAVREQLDSARATGVAEGEPVATDDEVVALLLRWIAVDRKHPALKELQGRVWQAGYTDGSFRGHVYDDVPPALTRWRERGLQIAIYSSGSVAAQRLLFGHSTHGDLNSHFAANFDTTVGHKRAVESYRRIAAALGVDPGRVAFLSDVEAELDAACEAGMQAVQLLRAGTVPSERHPGAVDFAAVDDRLRLK